jgi:acyl-CoA reductase-like NAD-dependent aldehyde dehydrogenase
MRYTFKDLVDMVPAAKRADFTKVYEYIHKMEDADGDELLQKVSKHFIVATSDIKSDKRLADIVLARQVFMTTVKVCTTKTLAEVARLINKDHATVCHAIKTLKRDYEFNAVRRNKIRQFIADLDPAKQELLLDFFNERNPDILTAYAIDVDRVATPPDSEA